MAQYCVQDPEQGLLQRAQPHAHARQAGMYSSGPKFCSMVLVIDTEVVTHFI